MQASVAAVAQKRGAGEGSGFVERIRNFGTRKSPSPFTASPKSVEAMEAMGAMALLPICDGSFTRDDYNTYRDLPWSRFPLRRAHPGPGPHTVLQGYLAHKKTPTPL